jgi:hypothetical protein
MLYKVEVHTERLKTHVEFWMLNLVVLEITARICKVSCKGEVCTSVLPFYVIASLPDDGHNFRPKHVVVNVMNKRIFSRL